MTHKFILGADETCGAAWATRRVCREMSKPSGRTVSWTLVALLAALVGALGALGAVWLQNWNQSRSSETDARESAYIDLLASSLALVRRARSLIATLTCGPGSGKVSQ